MSSRPRPADAACLDDRFRRPVLPPLAPVAAHHDARARRRAGTSRRQPAPDEELRHVVVDHLRPEVTVGCPVVAERDGAERFADDVTGIVVRARFVGVVAVCSVVIEPIGQTDLSLREESRRDPRGAVEPVVRERDVRGIPTDGIARVVGHREDDGGNRAASARRPRLPAGAHARDAAAAVADGLIVAQRCLPVFDRLSQVLALPGRHVGERARGGRARPPVAVGATADGELTRIGESLLALRNEQRQSPPLPPTWRRSLCMP